MKNYYVTGCIPFTMQDEIKARDDEGTSESCLHPLFFTSWKQCDIPADVQGKAVAIAAGDDHSVALLSDTRTGRSIQ